jgi:16S rRNA processing protein RimM
MTSRFASRGRAQAGTTGQAETGRTETGNAAAERPRRRPPLAANSEVAAERVAVGRIAAAHGLRGEVAVAVLSDVPGRFTAGASLLLSFPGASPRPVLVTAVRPLTSRHKDRLLLSLQGIDDRTAAEALRGALLEVAASAVPPAPAGTWYHFDLVGCRCTDRRAGELGEVAEVVEGGGGDLLRVVAAAGEGKPARELLLPFVDAYLAEVDVAGRRILWDLPEGLIEACGSAS